MICSKCGTENDGGLFCKNCFELLRSVPEVVSNISSQLKETKKSQDIPEIKYEEKQKQPEVKHRVFSLREISNAIVSGDVHLIKEYLESGGNPDLNERGTTLLMEASYFKQIDIVDMLIKSGASINSKNQDQLTALHYSLQYPANIPPMVIRGNFTSFKPFPLPSDDPELQMEIVKKLLDAGGEINPLKKTGNITQGELYLFKTPLQLAVELKRPEIVKLLLEKGANPNDTDYFNASPLIDAVNKGNLEIIQSLLGHGADINVQQRLGSTPLDRALSSAGNEIEMYKYTAEKEDGGIDERKLKEMEDKWFNIVECLAKGGANLEIEDDDGRTCIFSAICSGQSTLIEYLIKSGINLKHKDKNGTTVLHYLLSLGKFKEDKKAELLKILLEHGINMKETFNPIVILRVLQDIIKAFQL